jgi:integrating conjugative element protein (TIGR03761 family)
MTTEKPENTNENSPDARPEGQDDKEQTSADNTPGEKKTEKKAAIQKKPKKKLKLRPRTPRPGALKGDTTIDLHTVEGTYLYYGLNEGNQHIIGLRRFNEILTKVWINAPTDPWALWYLVRLEAAIHKSQIQVERMLKRHKDKLDNWKIRYKKSLSKDPVKIPVNFVAPLGFQAAILVVTADEAIRLILQAHHVGVIEDNLARVELHAVGKSVRRAFEQASTYRDMKVNYQELKERDPKALKAIEKMGEVPPEILSGKKRPRHVPRTHLTTRKPATQKAYWLENAADFFNHDTSKSDADKEKKP